tara:strand:+ start:266 stop:748 length:483 start_codon:yes stop_codon:yes gene_type:complete
MKLRTLRVYGFLMNYSGQVLIAVERYNAIPMVKFPGGGVDWGEGHRDALIREFKEELDLSVKVKNNIYFNDFAVESVIDSKFQVQSFFYIVEALGSLEFQTHTSIEFPETDGERFVWCNIEELDENMFTFKIEKQAAIAFKKYIKNIEDLNYLGGEIQDP